MSDTVAETNQCAGTERNHDAATVQKQTNQNNTAALQHLSNNYNNAMSLRLEELYVDRMSLYRK